MLTCERTISGIRGGWLDPLAKGRRAEWRPGSIPGHLDSPSMRADPTPADKP